MERLRFRYVIAKIISRRKEGSRRSDVEVGLCGSLGAGNWPELGFLLADLRLTRVLCDVNHLQFAVAWN
jgi:hypothetical protein